MQIIFTDMMVRTQSYYCKFNNNNRRDIVINEVFRNSNLINKIVNNFIFFFVQFQFFMYVDEYNDQPFPNIPTVSNNLFSSASNFSNKTTSPSTILSTLSIKHELLSEVNNVINTLSPENRSSPISSFENSVTTVNLPNVIPPYVLTNDLVDQFNHYRNIDIISRIKQCDSNMKLSDMCETYSFDNHTYSLIRQLDIKFHSLQDIYDSIIDRMTVQKLNIYCPTAQWCLGNLTKYNIRFTANTLRQRGRSFCSLETCRHRLDILAVTCPSISTEVKILHERKKRQIQINQYTF